MGGKVQMIKPGDFAAGSRGHGLEVEMGSAAGRWVVSRSVVWNVLFFVAVFCVSL